MPRYLVTLSAQVDGSIYVDADDETDAEVEAENRLSDMLITGGRLLACMVHDAG